MIDYRDGRASADLVRLQQEEKSLAQVVIEFCESRGLAPFLVAGSALGAWREGDLIPWDDDIDIGMVRPDYDAFIAAWMGEPQPEMWLQSHHTEPGYPLAYAKIRLDGTRVIEDAALPGQHHQGIFVDVFPFDSLPRSALVRGLQHSALSLINLFVMSYSREAAQNSPRAGLRLLRLAAFALRQLLPLNGLIALREWLSRMTAAGKSDEMASFEMYGIRYAWRTRVKREILMPPVRAKFGDAEMPVPANCEAYLAGVFGDFRKLPGEHSRKPMHVRAVRFRD